MGSGLIAEAYPPVYKVLETRLWVDFPIKTEGKAQVRLPLSVRKHAQKGEVISAIEAGRAERKLKSEGVIR